MIYKSQNFENRNFCFIMAVNKFIRFLPIYCQQKIDKRQKLIARICLKFAQMIFFILYYEIMEIGWPVLTMELYYLAIESQTHLQRKKRQKEKREIWCKSFLKIVKNSHILTIFLKILFGLSWFGERNQQNMRSFWFYISCKSNFDFQNFPIKLKSFKSIAKTLIFHWFLWKFSAIFF